MFLDRGEIETTKAFSPTTIGPFELAYFERLPVPNTKPNHGHSCGAFAPGTTWR
jgi:hypothetical protein